MALYTVYSTINQKSICLWSASLRALFNVSKWFFRGPTVLSKYLEKWCQNIIKIFKQNSKTFKLCSMCWMFTCGFSESPCWCCKMLDGLWLGRDSRFCCRKATDKQAQTNNELHSHRNLFIPHDQSFIPRSKHGQINVVPLKYCLHISTRTFKTCNITPS